MKDFTLCTNYTCSKKEKCERWYAQEKEKDAWQSFYIMEKDCEYYMSVEGQSEEKPPTGVGISVGRIKKQTRSTGN